MVFSLNSNGKRDLETYFIELQAIDKQRQEVTDQILKLIRHNKTLEARRQQILDLRQTYAVNFSHNSKVVFNNHIGMAMTGYSISDTRGDDASISSSRGGNSRSTEGGRSAVENNDEKSLIPTTEWTSKGIHMDSTIINNSVAYEERIEKWLATVQRMSKPELIFRASRDGWDSKEFQRHCAGKGATIAIIKTTKGHIFGGYSNIPWTRSRNGSYKRSKVAFLFVLKCAQKINACKMDIIKGKESKATYHCTQFGPSFGSGSDLHVASNANAADVNHSTIGNTFQLPQGITDPYFLTGSKLFQISEYEIFQV